MERKTFLQSGLSIAAAATIPGLSPSIPRALASEALKATTITWWGWGDPPLNPNLTTAPGVSHNSRNDAVKVLYEKSHPGVVIDATAYPYPDYVTALKTAFAGGNEPDTVELQPGALIGQYQPYLVPVDSYAAKLWGPQWRSQFYPLGVRETLNADRRHKTMYGLPVGLFAGNALYYNTAIFKKYNLKPPRSYAELKHIADILNSHNVIPIAWGAKDQWPNVDWYLMLAEQTAPGMWDAAQRGKATFTHPGLVRALEILVKMQKDGIFARGAWGTAAYPVAIGLFGSGKAAMYFTGDWDLHNFSTSKVHDQIDLFPLPPMAPGLKPGRLFGGTNMVAAVTQAAKNPQADFDFIAWQAGSVGQRETWVNRSLFLPSRKDIPIPRMPNEQYRRMKMYFYRALPRAIDREPLFAEVKQALQDAVANASTLGMPPARAMGAIQVAYDRAAKK